jgi:hypothetical protein
VIHWTAFLFVLLQRAARQNLLISSAVRIGEIVNFHDKKIQQMPF